MRYVITGLQLLLLVTAYVMKRLYSTKMGVMRHVVVISNKWRADFNPELVFTSLTLLLIALSLRQIKRLRRGNSPWQHIMSWVWLLLLSITFLLFILLTFNTWVHFNVVLLPILGAVLFLQLLQGIISLKKRT